MTYVFKGVGWTYGVYITVWNFPPIPVTSRTEMSLEGFTKGHEVAFRCKRSSRHKLWRGVWGSP